MLKTNIHVILQFKNDLFSFSHIKLEFSYGKVVMAFDIDLLTNAPKITFRSWILSSMIMVYFMGW